MLLSDYSSTVNEEGIHVTQGVSPNYLCRYRDPIRSCPSGSPILPQPVKLQQIQLSQSSNHSSSYDFTMTAAFTAELLSSPYQWSPPPLTHSGDPQRCWIGRPGCCQHRLCHLSCSAASCSSCDKTWVYSGAENTGLNLAVRRSASLSVAWQTRARIPRCQSVKSKAERACL